MPRKKNIELGKISISKLTNTMVEENDCLGVNLVFNNPFTDEQCEVLRNRYKMSVNDTGTELSREVNNSWKGLVMMLLTLSYFKSKQRVLVDISSYSEQWKYKRAHMQIKNTHRKDRVGRWSLSVVPCYYQLIPEPERTKLHNKYALIKYGTDEYMKALELPNGKAILTKRKEMEREENYKKEIVKISKEQATHYKELLNSGDLEQIRREQFIEQIPGPPNMKPLYVTGRFEADSIIGSIDVFALMLDIDKKKSIIRTEPSKPETLPHTYSVYPVICKMNTIVTPYT